jgi:urate oxidase
MSFELHSNSYGKSAVRLLRVTRAGPQHEVKDISVDIQFEGDFDEVHTKGDNSKVLPTDTMKNTVYALAGQQPVGEIEHFAQRLIAYFLDNNRQVSKVRVHILEHLWSRIRTDQEPHPSAFVSSGNERRTADVTRTRESTAITAGIEGLFVLRTAGSAFNGYISDPFTTLPETRDRILATVVNADWLYTMPDVSFGLCWRTIRDALLETFATHESESVQHTLYAMASVALERCDQISEISLSMPNKHHLPFDLKRLGMENRNEIFVPTDEPYGLIRATVRRAELLG